jgi:hypothetical protein
MESFGGRLARVVAPRRLSGLPSVRARVLAFATIVVGGACGGLIGYAFVSVQCTHRCTNAEGLGLVVGAVVTAIGVAVVAVLTLRAMGEWHRIEETDLLGGGT